MSSVHVIIVQRLRPTLERCLICGVSVQILSVQLLGVQLLGVQRLSPADLTIFDAYTGATQLQIALCGTHTTAFSQHRLDGTITVTHAYRWDDPADRSVPQCVFAAGNEAQRGALLPPPPPPQPPSLPPSLPPGSIDPRCEEYDFDYNDRNNVDVARFIENCLDVIDDADYATFKDSWCATEHVVSYDRKETPTGYDDPNPHVPPDAPTKGQRGVGKICNARIYKVKPTAVNKDACAIYSVRSSLPNLGRIARTAGDYSLALRINEARGSDWDTSTDHQRGGRRRKLSETHVAIPFSKLDEALKEYVNRTSVGDGAATSNASRRLDAVDAEEYERALWVSVSDYWNAGNAREWTASPSTDPDPNCPPDDIAACTASKKTAYRRDMAICVAWSPLFDVVIRAEFTKHKDASNNPLFVVIGPGEDVRGSVCKYERRDDGTCEPFGWPQTFGSEYYNRQSGFDTYTGATQS